MPGLGENRFNSLLSLGIEVFGLFEQRGIAQNDGERIVELAGYVSSQLAEADELFRVDQLLEHHGLAAGSLNARGKHLKRQQINGMDRLVRIAEAGEEKSAFGCRASAERNGVYRCEFETAEIISGEKKRLQIQIEGLAVFDARVSPNQRQESRIRGCG